MAFLGDALAHAILPGVAIAYLVGGNLLLGALVAALLVAVGIGFFSRRGGVKEDTAIGILFAAALALGVVLISTMRSYATDLTHILFGNVLGVSTGDLWLTGILAVIVLTVLILFYKEFLLASFDPVLAHTLGSGPSRCASPCWSCWRSPSWSGCRRWAWGWWPPCWSRRRRPRTC